MNRTAAPRPFVLPEALEARVAYRMAARLTEQSDTLPADISERLRFAREQALQRAHAARSASASAHPVLAQAQGTLTLGRLGPSSWWVKLGSVLPLLLLAAGLIGIQQLHTRSQITAAAEIDASILADDLPPAAYSDPGFLEFLKAPPRD